MVYLFTNIKFIDTNKQLILYNSLGQKSRTLELNSENNYSAEVNDLENGVYYLASPMNKFTEKIVIVK